MVVVIYVLKFLSVRHGEGRDAQGEREMSWRVEAHATKKLVDLSNEEVSLQTQGDGVRCAEKDKLE